MDTTLNRGFLIAQPFVAYGHFIVYYVLNQNATWSDSRVSNLDRALIVGQIQSGASTRTVALRFNIANYSVNIIYNKYLETQDVKDLPRSGRPRCTTQHEDNF